MVFNSGITPDEVRRKLWRAWMICVSPKLGSPGRTIDVKKKQWKQIAIVLGLLPLLVFFLTRSFRVNIEEHQKYQQLFVHQFIHHENLIKDLIKAKYKIFFSYDFINKSFDLLKEDFTQLQSIPTFINQQGQDRIRALLDSQVRELSVKEEEIERFKTRNAAVKNSLRYLPELKAEILDRLSSDLQDNSGFQDDKIELVEPLLQDILQYNLTSDRALALNISFNIHQLQQLKKTINIDEKTSSIDLFILHSQIILDGQYELNRLSNRLTENNLIRSTEKIEKLYLSYYNKALKEANFYRLLSLAILLGVLIWASYLVIHRLVKINRHITQMNNSLEATLQELKRTQAQLIQTEKMSSLGQMVAGIAHEINNPVSFIYSNVKPASEYIQDLSKLLRAYEKECPNPSKHLRELSEEIELDFIQEDLNKILMSMKFGAERIQKIVLSLRSFSRLDESEIKTVNLHEGIESALVILHNKLVDDAGNPVVSVMKNYGDLPAVTCYPSQLNQVFLNILDNAIDALVDRNAPIVSETEPSKVESTQPVKNTIVITTEVARHRANSAPDCAIVRIQDNGPGIPKSIQSHIFDPFFTTKPVGKGTGLGLSIGYQIIVKKHKGTLKCFSNPQDGTEFYIEIPLHLN